MTNATERAAKDHSKSDLNSRQSICLAAIFGATQKILGLGWIPQPPTKVEIYWGSKFSPKLKAFQVVATNLRNFGDMLNSHDFKHGCFGNHG